MDVQNSKLPFYVKLSYFLLCMLLGSFILYHGKDIVVPLLFSTLLAIFLLRPVSFLEKRKWCPHFLSILLPLAGALAAIGGVVYFIYSQLAFFAEDFPILKERIAEQATIVQDWIYRNLKIPLQEQNQYINETLARLKNSGVIGRTFLSITSNLTLVVLIPVFTYLLLYYKEHIVKFFTSIFQKNEKRVKEVMHESHLIIQSYLGGLVIELVIVVLLNIIGLSLVGVKYAILLAILAGVLNLIPYLGMLSATLFAMMLTLVTAENTIDIIWVAVTLGMVQLVDNYIIMPLIVGSKVQINVLATILGVLIGGALLAVPGMFLSIPTIAVIKVVCDRIEGMKPWGALLGNHANLKESRWKWKLFGKNSKKISFRTQH